jgi:transcriptional regulator with XRE-family HTH domain
LQATKDKTEEVRTMSYPKIRGAIREKFGKNEAFAEAMGMDKSTLSKKLNGRTEWTRPEIELAVELLTIPWDQIHIYFFAD